MFKTRSNPIRVEPINPIQPATPVTVYVPGLPLVRSDRVKCLPSAGRPGTSRMLCLVSVSLLQCSLYFWNSVLPWLMKINDADKLSAGVIDKYASSMVYGITILG